MTSLARADADEAPNYTAAVAVAKSQTQPYTRTPVSPNSAEHAAVMRLVGPHFAMCSPYITRVVNPSLVDQFEARRRLLRAKKISGPSSSSSSSSSLSSPIPVYTDNIALLFHCTRAPLNSVLAEGLDNRVANGGLLGRGIYFADDVQKSMGYDGQSTILVFCVMLGDCLHVPVHTLVQTAVREPPKTEAQKRNKDDLFFDSIVSKPSTANEYVIYNAAQCYPLYAISYTRPAVTYPMATQQLPPFIWSTTPNLSGGHWPFLASAVFGTMKADCEHRLLRMSDLLNSNAISEKDEEPSSINADWTCVCCSTKNDEDFYSCYSCGRPKATPRSVFRKRIRTNHNGFGSSGSSSGNSGSGVTRGNANSIGTQSKNNVVVVVSDSEGESIPKKSKSLVTGNCLIDLTKSSSNTVLECDTVDLTSDSSSTAPLFQFGTTTSGTQFGRTNIFTVEDDDEDCEAINFLRANSQPVVVASVAPASISSAAPKEIECQICASDYPETDFRPLSCCKNTTMCQTCITQLTKILSTMSNTPYTHLKCPFCNKTTGTLIGECPTGTMTANIISVPGGVPGFPGCNNAIVITYNISTPPHFLHRVAYLPDNPQGRDVLSKLQIAWDRRLTFRIGTSATSGQQNVLVWAIHHKTSISGGVQRYGFPDESYLERVEEELKERGVI
ncbi:E3 ubiquitin-protein ligase dtx3l [Physocladia obscura]|uniref:Poly [ADP-ribose] polymerase n=1 Tax=Physocladia obscura TaxID=109957 RepID=A0AAD5T208_9FUNG|nr:E3 ubiquitin-protein ligase dtx3l [Physocladia obscura]